MRLAVDFEKGFDVYEIGGAQGDARASLCLPIFFKMTDPFFLIFLFRFKEIPYV